MKLHFQMNIISFTSTNILSFDEKIGESKTYDVKIKTSENWNLSKSITFDYLLSEYHFMPLWHMANKMMIN